MLVVVAAVVTTVVITLIGLTNHRATATQGSSSPAATPPIQTTLIAGLNNPFDVAVGADSSVYVTDYSRVASPEAVQDRRSPASSRLQARRQSMPYRAASRACDGRRQT